MRPALPITVAYVLLASLWIWVTQWLLARLGGAYWEISAAGLIFGEIFVLVTGALLYLLVDRLHGVRSERRDFDRGQLRGPQAWLAAMAVVLVLIAGVQILIAVVAARQYAPLLFDKAQPEASSLAAIRAIGLDRQVGAIAQRREELQDWVAELDDGVVEDFPAELSQGGLLSHFQAITLLDPDRNPRLQSGAPSVLSPDSWHFDQAAATAEVQTVTRFAREHGGVDLFWILPIFDERTAVSRGPWYLLFWSRLNTLDLVEEGAEGWSLQGQADEEPQTPLIRGSVKSGTTPSFWPVLTPDSSEESGRPGEILGEIPSKTPGEMPAPVEQMEKRLSVTLILSTLGTLAALIFLWRFLRGGYQNQIHNFVRERDFWHYAWLDMPSLGLIELDPGRLNVMAANRQAANWLGRSRESLVGSALFELFEPTDPGSPLGDAPESALSAYFARGAVDCLVLEGRLPERPSTGPMWLELRVLRSLDGQPGRMIGILRPAQVADDSALRGQIDHLAAVCATLPADKRQAMLGRLVEQADSPFLAVLPVIVDTAELFDRAALKARLEQVLPASLRHHEALLWPLADELGRVLVSGEGRWVHDDSSPGGIAVDPHGNPVVISTVGHSVVMLPVATGTDGQVIAQLYISRDRWEITPSLLAAIERLHQICQLTVASSAGGRSRRR
ncbi:MAG: PAS domain-containing protein [Halothiobacillaceae bacterium]